MKKILSKVGFIIPGIQMRGLKCGEVKSLFHHPLLAGVLTHIQVKSVHGHGLCYSHLTWLPMKANTKIQASGEEGNHLSSHLKYKIQIPFICILL